MNKMRDREYNPEEIIQILLKMRDNCVPKDSDAYDDPERMEKYKALNVVINIINNPSLLMSHGKWIEVGSYDEDGYYDVEYKCSECDRFECTKQPYCHCGAKMDL